MQLTFRKAKRYATALLLLGVNLSMTACGSSSFDNAYYGGGDQFALKGGYTRTIFSTSNF